MENRRRRSSLGKAALERHQIDNPLRAYKLPQIKQAARKFARNINADEELCVRAVQVAYDPPNWSNVPGITPREREALENERSEEDGGFAGRWKRFRADCHSRRHRHDQGFFSSDFRLLFRRGGFWYQTKALRVTVVCLCFSAIVQGFVQSVSNGANQTMPEYFKLKHDNPVTNNHEWVSTRAIWQFSTINAITYLAAGICGCWFSDPLQSGVLGRRGAIFVSGCLCFAAAIGAACSSKWWVVLIWRGILGIGLGSKASVTPIFGAEVAPSHLRGTLVMNWQLYDALGIFCGFTANLIFYWTGSWAWKFQTASAAVPAGVLIALVWTIPESPRWLLKRGRGAEAFSALCDLRPTQLQAATELLYANAQIQMELRYFHNAGNDVEATPTNAISSEKEGSDGVEHVENQDIDDLASFSRYRDAVKATNYLRRITCLFSTRRIRRSTVAASVCMIGQQLCGVNVLAFYSTVFFQDLNGHSTRNIDALWLSWGVGLANFLFTFPAYWGIDRLGRRYLLLVTYPGMIFCLLGASLSFLGGTDNERSIRVGVFTFLFIFFYSIGQGPVAFAYASEVFPLFNREAGMSWAVFVNLFSAGLLTLFVPLAQVARDDWLNRQAILLGSFAGLCTFSLVLIFLLVPETKLATTTQDKKMTVNYISLEELNHIFSVRTRLLIKYQTTHVVPYAYKTIMYHLGIEEEKPTLEVMYYWAESRQSDDSRGGGNRQSDDSRGAESRQSDDSRGAESRQSDDSRGGESDQDTSTCQTGSPKLSPQVRHDTSASYQHQDRLKQEDDAITRIASPSGARMPSPS